MTRTAVHIDEAGRRRADSAIAPDAAVSPPSHCLMFVILASLSFALFGLTVLLPLLREHTEILAEEERLTVRVAALEAESRRRSDLLDAFQHDTQIIERLALLDLNYQRPDEVVLPVYLAPGRSRSPEQVAESPPTGPLLLPAGWPAWAHRAQAWADRKGLVRLFLNPTLRPVFLLMSGGLIVAAFVVFAPRPREPAGFFPPAFDLPSR